MKKGLLFLLLATISIGAWAADGDDFYAETVEGITMRFQVTSEADGTAQVWRPSSNQWGAPVAVDKNTEGHITIPSEVNGYTITSICEEAFYYCDKITSVEIPNTVTYIGERAFCGCKELADVNLPSSLIEIDDAAFYGTAVSKVVIPASVTRIGSTPYGECSNLASIVVDPDNSIYDSRNNCNAIIKTSTDELNTGCNNTIIPDDIKSIGWMSFKGCSGLKSLVIPASLTSISYTAFELCEGIETIEVDKDNPVYDSRNNCNAIIETASNTLVRGSNNTVIPDNITTIGDDAFHGSNIESIIVPESVTKINGHAFEYCRKMTSISLPESIKEIEYMVFLGCESLKSIMIPQSVTSIGFCTFYGCKSFNTVVIPDGVKILDQQAFYECEGLTSVTIGRGVTSIGSSAFEGCRALEEIISKIENPFEISVSVFDNSGGGQYVYPTATLYVPVGCIEAYRNTASWNKFQNIKEIGESTSIGEAIDLGLPSGTKWASWNVGALKPEDFGGYYAWGETEEKDTYTWDNYQYGNYNYEDDSSQIVDIGSDIGGTDYDVAHLKWRGEWRLPSIEHINELRNNCTFEWTTLNGVNGCRFTGPNGNSIFLPATGQWDNGTLVKVGEWGDYLSSSKREPQEGEVISIFCEGLLFNSEAPEWWYANPIWGQYCGRCVRPIIPGTRQSDQEIEARKSALLEELDKIKAMLAYAEDMLARKDPNRQADDLWERCMMLEAETKDVEYRVMEAETLDELDVCAEEIDKLRAMLDELMYRIEEYSAVTARFDGLTAWVSGDVPLDEAFMETGGREAAAQTIAAIVWENSYPLTADMLQGISNPNLLVYVTDASLAPEGVQNVVVNGQAQEIILTDATTGNNNFYCPEPFRTQRISYTRNFQQHTVIGTSRGWEGLTLPFPVQTITHATQGQITPFRNDGSNKHFWLRQMRDNGLTYAQTIEPNVPYLIAMPNSTEYYSEFNLSGRVTFSAENTEVYSSENKQQVGTNEIILIPTFTRVAASDDVYALNVGNARDGYAEGSVFIRNSREVRPFEVYTNHMRVGGARPRFIPVNATTNNETVGIKDIEHSTMNNEQWYSVDGRQLQGEPKTKGVYIQKGKKIIK